MVVYDGIEMICVMSEL